MNMPLFVGPRLQDLTNSPDVPEESSLVAATLCLALPGAAYIRVHAIGAPSQWLARAYDQHGRRTDLPMASAWAGRLVRANPQADWSQTLDFALATGALTPAGIATSGAAA
ncbi:hypothetical protein [Streptacidiphilus sp. MAP5-52]|uniref:hypothetical protein n=1 Tax=Streptacidiphilus sp. MAP5-52 TaxID=3156267 RepID=UPI003515CE44